MVTLNHIPHGKGSRTRAPNKRLLPLGLLPPPPLRMPCSHPLSLLTSLGSGPGLARRERVVSWHKPISSSSPEHPWSLLGPTGGPFLWTPIALSFWRSVTVNDMGCLWVWTLAKTNQKSSYRWLSSYLMPLITCTVLQSCQFLESAFQVDFIISNSQIGQWRLKEGKKAPGHRTAK